MSLAWGLIASPALAQPITVNVTPDQGSVGISTTITVTNTSTEAVTIQFIDVRKPNGDLVNLFTGPFELAPGAQLQTIVPGAINDLPGTYTVGVFFENPGLVEAFYHLFDSVGGTVELLAAGSESSPSTDSGSDSSAPYAAIAVGIAGAFSFAVGGWYVRRRSLRRSTLLPPG